MKRTYCFVICQHNNQWHVVADRQVFLWLYYTEKNVSILLFLSRINPYQSFVALHTTTLPFSPLSAVKFIY